MAKDTHMSRVAIIVLMSLVATSCTYFEFTMKEYTGWPIQTKILRERHSVQRTTENAIQLSNGARIGMRCKTITEGVFSTEIRLNQGSTLRLQTHTTPYDDSIASIRGMIIEIGNDQTTVVCNGVTSRIDTPLPDHRPFVVEIISDGRWTILSVACTEVGRFATNSPSTQWIIASLVSGGSALIADPSFQPLYTAN